MAGGPPMPTTTLDAPSIRSFIADGLAVARCAITAAKLTLTRHQEEDHLHFITFSCYRRLPSPS
jgi:hypothetical protein